MMMVTRLVPLLIPTIPTIPDLCLTKAEMMPVVLRRMPIVVMVEDGDGADDESEC